MRPWLYRFGLLAPLAAILFFPASMLLGGRLLDQHRTWNEGIMGVVEPARPVPPLGWRRWWQGDFQREMTDWIDRRYPGKQEALFAFNQANQALLDSSYMTDGDLLMGRKGHLLQMPYVLDALGQQPGSQRQMDDLVGQIQKLRDQLAARHKKLLVLVTPQKAATYPDLVPTRFLRYRVPGPRRYDLFAAALARSDLAYLDGAALVHRLAAQPELLFATGGIHWNARGAWHVLGPLFEKLAAVSGQPLPHPRLIRIQEVARAQADNKADYDVAEMLNVLRPPEHRSCNLTWRFDAPLPPATPKIVFAGGSFTITLLHLLHQAPDSDLAEAPLAFYFDRYLVGALDQHISARTYWNRFNRAQVVVLEVNETIPTNTIEKFSAFLRAGSPPAAEPQASFREGGNSGQHVLAGFSVQEPGWRWSDGPSAALLFELPEAPRDYQLTVRAKPFLQGGVTRQSVEMLANGATVGTFVWQTPDFQEVRARFRGGGETRIEFRFADAVSPAALGLGDDARKLGLAFQSVAVTPVAAAVAAP